jgi:hemerythrin-like domain-containing protein
VDGAAAIHLDEVILQNGPALFVEAPPQRVRVALLQDDPGCVPAGVFEAGLPVGFVADADEPLHRDAALDWADGSSVVVHQDQSAVVVAAHPVLYRWTVQAFGDEHHQEKEEAILFPALLKASHAEEHACLCQITFEHNQQRSLLEGIEDALRSRKGKDFVYYARRLAENVRAHIQSEDDDVFKRADALLSIEEDERIAKELAAYDSTHRAERLRELIKRLFALETKYVLHPSPAFEKSHYV